MSSDQSIKNELYWAGQIEYKRQWQCHIRLYADSILHLMTVVSSLTWELKRENTCLGPIIC